MPDAIFGVIAQEFQVGDKVTAIAFTDCFGVHHAEVPGLTITDVRKNEWIERGVDRSYYRFTARKHLHMIEGAARYFRLDVVHG